MQLKEITKKVPFNLDEKSELTHFLYYLWEGKFIILAITFITMVISIIFVSNKPVEYEGNTLIQIEEKNQDDSIKFTPFHLGSGTNAIAYQSALIQSRVILDPIIEQLNLGVRVEPVGLPYIRQFFYKSIQKEFHLNKFKIPVSYLDQYLKIKTNNGIYQIIDTNKNILITGKLGELITQNNLSVQIDKLPVHVKEFYIIKHSNTTIIKNLLSRLRVQELGDSTANQTGILQISLKDQDPERLAKILNAITIGIKQKSMERKSQETSKTLDFLNEQLPIVQKALQKAEDAFNRYRAHSGKIDIKVQSEQLMEQLARIEKQLMETQLHQANILQIYTKQHPTAVELNNKIIELKKIKEFLINQIKSMPESDQVAMNLMREVKVKNDLYLILLNKIQELQVVNSGTLSDVRILAEALPPDSMVPRQTLLVVVASFILGIILGSIILLLKKSFLRRLSDPHWVERHLNLPNLAIIPYSEQQTKNKIKYKSNLSKRVEILAEINPKDLSIEALRSLRTSFELLLTEPQKNIISFTGVSPGVGKSFVSMNFSYLLANVEKKILLIDGDIRRGDLHSYFPFKQSPGLNELVTGVASLEEVLHKTSSDYLDFISCGAYPEKPAELLMRKNFKNILNHLKEQYDYIIIDTAPVLAVTDSSIIATLAHLNFLIIGSNVHQPEEIVLSIKRLENAGAKLAGTIFNNLNKKSASFYGQYRYDYSYYGTDELKTSSLDY